MQSSRSQDRSSWRKISGYDDGCVAAVSQLAVIQGEAKVGEFQPLKIQKWGDGRFLVPAHPGCVEKMAINGCCCYCYYCYWHHNPWTVCLLQSCHFFRCVRPSTASETNFPVFQLFPSSPRTSPKLAGGGIVFSTCPFVHRLPNV